MGSRIDEILTQRVEIEQKGKERAVERISIQKADVLAMLIEDRRLAREKGQVAAAVRAAKLLGKQLGMFIERREQGRPGTFDGLSDAELEQRLVDRLGGNGIDEKRARALIRARVIAER